MSEEYIRSEFHCHACGKTFVAELDITIDGNYELECASCAHTHYRAVKKGVVTDVRWGSDDSGSKLLKPRSVWKSSVIKAQTSTVAAFLRERWLNRSDINAS